MTGYFEIPITVCHETAGYYCAAVTIMLLHEKILKFPFPDLLLSRRPRAPWPLIKLGQ